jgi:GNAT superfamily N-acetyltransferase/nitroimidazol reductase NimA-like FMN-containing flavoprotein (pyridoxamine 5'-phosphate oxidase superfamily)
MRRREFLGTRELGLALFHERDVLHLAGVDAGGTPVLKTLNGVMDEGWICFHGAPMGEKTSLIGRPVVVSVEETVCRLPSYFSDPERACPATTLYRAAQAKGVLRLVDEPTRKARVLQRLMEKLQPEGGYVPIDAGSPLYRAQVNGLLVAGVPLDELTVKVKLAQNRPPAARATILERLWARGAPGDVRALELIRQANPDTPVPTFLRAPPGLTLRGWLPAHRAEDAVALVLDEYWNDGFTREELARAHRGASAWVGATDDAGALIATARAISDGAKNAWIYDVCVRHDWRGRGVGKSLMRLLLDHPAVRGVRVLRLGTRDAMSLYRPLGFVPLSEVPPRPYQVVEMVLRRPAA